MKSGIISPKEKDATYIPQVHFENKSFFVNAGYWQMIAFFDVYVQMIQNEV